MSSWPPDDPPGPWAPPEAPEQPTIAPPLGSAPSGTWDASGVAAAPGGVAGAAPGGVAGVSPAPWGAPPRSSPNGWSVAALVLGIIAFVFGLIPVFGLVGFPIGFFGLVTGGVGLATGGSRARSGRGMALWGMALSVLGPLIAVAWIAGIMGFLGTLAPSDLELVPLRDDSARISIDDGAPVDLGFTWQRCGDAGDDDSDGYAGTLSSELTDGEVRIVDGGVSMSLDDGDGSRLFTEDGGWSVTRTGDVASLRANLSDGDSHAELVARGTCPLR